MYIYIYTKTKKTFNAAILKILFVSAILCISNMPQVNLSKSEIAIRKTN